MSSASCKSSVLACCILGTSVVVTPGLWTTSWADHQPDPTLDPAMLGVMEELGRRADDVRDLTARYEERKHTALLKKPLVTRGRVRIVGTRARWDADSPRKTVTLLDPSEVRIYYPERSTVEVYPIGAHLQFPTVSPLPRWAELREHFRIEARSAMEMESKVEPSGYLFLSLTPLRPALREYVETVDVAIDRSSGLLHRADITDPDGDRTIMIFSDARTNTGLASDDLSLDLPAGTLVTWPISPEKASDSKAARD